VLEVVRKEVEARGISEGIAVKGDLRNQQPNVYRRPSPASASALFVKDNKVNYPSPVCSVRGNIIQQSVIALKM